MKISFFSFNFFDKDIFEIFSDLFSKVSRYSPGIGASMCVHVPEQSFLLFDMK